MLHNSYTIRQSTFGAKTSRKHFVAKCCSEKHVTNIPSKLSSFFDKKKEIDRSRWEKVKEISRTIDHIAKSDVKQTYELLKELAPVVGQSVDKKDNELKSVDLEEEGSS
jgi:hypothetical protein